MPINLKNFIFHSDYLPLPLDTKESTSIIMSGSVPASGATTFFSPWIDVGEEDLLLDFVWTIPTPPAGWTIGGVDSNTTAPGSRLSDTRLRMIGPGWSSTSHGIYVERNGSNQVRAVIVTTNQTVSSKTLPTVTFNFDIYTFINKNS